MALKLKPNKKEDKPLSIAELFSLLLTSAPQAHVFHLQQEGEVGSYAQHKALEEYYTGIVALTDMLIETYQGTHGIVKGYSAQSIKDKGSIDPLQYIESVYNKVLASRSLFADSDLLNIVDEITRLLKSTMYKLKNLK